MAMQYAPIVLFVYNRPHHVRQIVDALSKNSLAGESELFIFSDGPKDKETQENVTKVREYIKTITGFKSITIIERERNFGLSQSVIAGVTEIIAKYGRIIALEDDLIVAPYFLQFMNDSLSVYQDEEKVISICGYMYPLRGKYQDTLFFRVADCWGWATWKRGWDLFVASGKELYNTLRDRKLLIEFNIDGAFNYTTILKRQIQGKNDSWAVRWYASALLNGKLSLYPRKSLVINIGFDGSGRHGGVIDYFKTKLLNELIKVHKIPIFEDEQAAREIGFYLRKQQLFKIGNKAMNFLRK